MRDITLIECRDESWIEKKFTEDVKKFDWIVDKTRFEACHVVNIELRERFLRWKEKNNGICWKRINMKR